MVEPRATYRIRPGWTPLGAGMLVLIAPGLLSAVFTGQVAVIAPMIGAAVLILADLALARMVFRDLVVLAAVPASAYEHQAVNLDLTVTTRRPARLLATVGGRSEPVVLLSPGSARLSVDPGERGLVDRVQVILEARATLGLVAAVASATVPLHRPLAVAPIPAAQVVRAMGAAAETSGRDDEPVGVRPYVPGDRQRDIHWPTVARSRTLMVRERARHRAAERVTVVVGGINERCPGERLAAARRIAEAVLDTGGRVMLSTVEAFPPPRRVLGESADDARDGLDFSGTSWVVGTVSDRQELAARLARAELDPAGDGCGPDVVPSASGLVTLDESGVRWGTDEAGAAG
ncbi:MAG: DUF58 domain-containing protein [Acidimicrobiales bacterium]